MVVYEIQIVFVLHSPTISFRLDAFAPLLESVISDWKLTKLEMLLFFERMNVFEMLFGDYKKMCFGAWIAIMKRDYEIVFIEECTRFGFVGVFTKDTCSS